MPISMTRTSCIRSITVWRCESRSEIVQVRGAAASDPSTGEYTLSPF